MVLTKENLEVKVDGDFQMTSCIIIKLFRIDMGMLMC